MPLQNRVDPFGQIHAVAARGMFTGNRGVIHDPATKTLLKRRWATKTWIVCACEYKGWRREPMGRNGPNGGTGWTELFFLDEVTALAAGHRPCFLCRHERAKQFAACYGRAFGVARPLAPDIDTRLHRERSASGGTVAEIARRDLGSLPDGAMVFDGKACHAISGGHARRWSFSGYGPASGFDALASEAIAVITPATTLAVLREGYSPVWHPGLAAPEK